MTQAHSLCVLAFTVSASAMSAPALADPTDAVLAELKRQQDRIRATSAARPKAPVGWEGAVPDVKVLIGVERKRIHTALGDPGDCRNQGTRPPACTNARVWTYAFVWLPPNYAGGGLELILVFERGKVRDARWERSA